MDLAEATNDVFKSLKDKGKITEKQLKYFTIAIRWPLIWERCIYYLKFTKDFLMFLGDQLYRIAAGLKKSFKNFG